MAENKPEIDWGEDRRRAEIGADPRALLAAHLRRNESEEQRRRRQLKLDEQLLEKRRARRRRVLVPLAVVVLVAGSVAGVLELDRHELIRLPFLHHHDRSDRLLDLASAQAPPPPAPDLAPPPAPAAAAQPIADAQPDAAAPVVAVAAAAPDPEAVRKISARLERAELGVGVQSRELAERAVMLATEDQLLRGTYNPDRAHRRSDSLYDQSRAAAATALTLQAAARAQQPGAAAAYSSQLILLQNLQARIQNTITNETHDVEIYRSIQARLAKVTSERDQLQAELAAGAPGTPAP